MRALNFQFKESKMSNSEQFKDSTSIGHLLVGLIVLVCAPLLPTVMGWFTLLSN